jgi:hypothetical protein
MRRRKYFELTSAFGDHDCHLRFLALQDFLQKYMVILLLAR